MPLILRSYYLVPIISFAMEGEGCAVQESLSFYPHSQTGKKPFKLYTHTVVKGFFKDVQIQIICSV